MKYKFKRFYNIDTEFYKSYYTDLSNLSVEQAIFHYEKYGKHENRIINNVNLKLEVERNFCIMYRN